MQKIPMKQNINCKLTKKKDCIKQNINCQLAKEKEQA